jgi:hypothetical protein
MERALREKRRFRRSGASGEAALQRSGRFREAGASGEAPSAFAFLRYLRLSVSRIARRASPCGESRLRGMTRAAGST